MCPSSLKVAAPIECVPSRKSMVIVLLQWRRWHYFREGEGFSVWEAQTALMRSGILILCIAEIGVTWSHNKESASMRLVLFVTNQSSLLLLDTYPKIVPTFPAQLFIGTVLSTSLVAMDCNPRRFGKSSVSDSPESQGIDWKTVTLYDYTRYWLSCCCWRVLLHFR